MKLEMSFMVPDGRANAPSDAQSQNPAHSRELSTPSRTAWTKPGALRFLEGEAGSEGTDPPSHAPGLGLHFPEAGDWGKPKLAGD